MEAKCIRISLNHDALEPYGGEARTKRDRINRNQRVTNVNQSHDPTIQAVAADENSAWLQHPPDLAEHHVLQFARSDMMQHGETNSG